MSAYDHPYWTIYGVITVCLYGLLFADLSHNGRREPEDRIPPIGYAAWAVLNGLWPVIVLLVVAVILSD